MYKVNKVLEKWFPNFTCTSCGAEIIQTASPHLCSSCFDKLPFVQQASKSHYCPFVYKEPIRTMVLTLKYSNNRYVVAAVAPYMAAIYLKYIKKNRVHVLIPVPLCKKRMKERGYNQSELLAGEIADYLNMELLTDVLVRVKITDPQKDMTTQERIENIRNVFKVENSDKIKGKNILLIDDVYTSGATSFECAKTLKKCGVKSVSILTIAEADSDPFPE